jgi:protein-histidine pros-kinase
MAPGTDASPSQPDVVLNLFRVLADSNPQAILIMDRQGRIVLVNTAAERLFGYSSNQLVSQEAEILVPGLCGDTPAEEREQLFLEQSDHLKNGRELEGIHKDGRRFPVEVGLNPVKTERGFFAFCSIFDVSDRKQAQTALEDSHAIHKSLVENLPIRRRRHCSSETESRLP